jgi:poly(3-hydroxybutyrate) depolymerase
MAVVLDGVADGNYRVVGKVMEGEEMVASLEQGIWLAKGIDEKRGGIVERLGKIEGHEGTKASIMYPFDVARVVNIGKRGYNDQDLGINQAGVPNYLNFAAELKRSEELLTALEAGKDPLWQAKGDVKRHYYFAQGDEIMPYRVRVPENWDGKTPLPMVFILHGNTRNQDFYFERDGGIIPKTADKYGFMLVGVFGYHPNGGYNLSAMLGAGRGAGGGAVGRGVVGGSFGPAAVGRGGRGGGGGFMNGMPQGKIGELSEADTMQVFDLVKKEYPIDPKRTFLFGYSAGGNGGYYIGGKYGDNWAAIALGGANTSLGATYPYYEKLKGLSTPFFIYYGEKDNVQNGSRVSVQALNDHGVAAELKSFPGADHDGTPSAAVGDAFEFFSKHGRK